MPVDPPADPIEPETFEDTVNDDDIRPTTDEPGTETPEADAAEQRTEVREPQDGPSAAPIPDDVNPADAAEQARVVELDEDDYR
ncbi:hypothetical protein [Streptomyces sp. GSL17-111]|uniref:hypothetical protein n=1 Tax=Streptomyces sp. GSL17-111 TaxID=3121596 RepID=UPI0030F43F1A